MHVSLTHGGYLSQPLDNHLSLFHILIYVYMYVYIYKYIRIYVYTFIRLYVYTDLHIYVYTYIRIYSSGINIGKVQITSLMPS